MKFTTSTALIASGLVANAAATAPSPNTIYKLKVNSTTTGLSGAIVTVKDESAGTSATPLGVWSSGEPRNPYTFTLTKSTLSDKLYELNGSLKKTHAILHGNTIALGFFDVAIGADPKATDKDALFTNQWLATEDTGSLRLLHAERFKAGAEENTFVGAGTWRACKGDSQAAFPDYQIVWFDGHHNITALFGQCVTVDLNIVEHQKASSTSGWITGVTAPTAGGKSITGVPAPSTTDANGNWITGVPAPSGNSTSFATPKPKPFEGAASHLGFAGMFVSGMMGTLALFL
ncbi:hypothetical protein CC80DRAFT_500282 [Byssothecium circinans]|uniref:Uncharacterized protein n=1 Tax=Byssothecium circinans TaxID=147558 RepID=A0A6A5UC84_9PLEO|nr:hypothetical protein CC80DRAFT_500282 [Byssothecium circinans]